MASISVGILPEVNSIDLNEWEIWVFASEEYTVITFADNGINVHAFMEAPVERLQQLLQLIDVGCIHEDNYDKTILALSQLDYDLSKDSQNLVMTTLHSLEADGLILFHVDGWMDLEAIMDRS